MSLYLSRLILNLRSKRVITELAQPYEMHRTLMRAFPKVADDVQSKAREEFGVLFRADVDEKRRVAQVYVQSCVEPDWSFLNDLDDYLYANASTQNCEYKDILPAYQKLHFGQVLSFRLRANPTKRVAKPGDPMKGKRVELRREQEQLDWLMRKGKEREKDVSGGFELLTMKIRDEQGDLQSIPRVKVCADGKQWGRKREAARGHATTHFAVTFDGLLRVTDAKAFLGTLTRGIGSGKAFGFGLLSVAPAPHLDAEDEA